MTPEHLASHSFGPDLNGSISSGHRLHDSTHRTWLLPDGLGPRVERRWHFLGFFPPARNETQRIGTSSGWFLPISRHRHRRCRGDVVRGRKFRAGKALPVHATCSFG